MIEHYEEQLDITNSKIKELEKNIAVMHENIMTVAEQIKETQLFLVKLAKNQSELTKRVSQWPYIAVSKEQGE